MDIYTMPLGMVQANCYVLVKDHHCLVIDPGGTFDLNSFVSKYELQVDAILLTHAHFDHIQGVDAIVDQFHVPVYVHASETAFLQDASLNASMSFYETVICRAKALPLQEKHQKIGLFDIDIIHTPGHSCGSCCFLIEGHLFSGDTLFQGSIGRMDLPTGSVMDMKQSLRTLSQLDDRLPVHPGHGNSTTIGQEKQWNPEMRQLAI